MLSNEMDLVPFPMTLGYGNRYQRTSEHISAIFESLLKLRTLVVKSPFCAGATPLKQHNTPNAITCATISKSRHI